MQKITYFMILLTLSGCCLISTDLQNFAEEGNNEDLVRTICTFYEGSEKRVGTAGVILSETVGNGREYYILTADHVINQMGKNCHGQLLYVGFASESDITIKSLLPAPYDKIPKFGNRIHTNNRSDLGILKITGAIRHLPKIGAGIRCIDLDVLNSGSFISNDPASNLVKGVGIAYRRDFADLGIDTGSDMFCICSNINSPAVFIDNTHAEDSLEYFTGKLKHIDVNVSDNIGGHSSVIILEGHQVENGNSGSPVFAWGNINGRRYPFLVGVVQGKVPGKNETSVMPIDGLDILLENIE